MLQHGQLLWRTIARQVSTSSARQQQQINHYEALGIGKSSTQNEIKAAYYKLSMLYHPDRNQGSESAAKKFRQINQAYEVLGNYRLRRLYDKGIVHTAGSQYAQNVHDMPEEVEDDPETKFYKSRFQKSKVADTSGRTPIYDFDEWSRAHYAKSFDRRQNTKEKHERIVQQKQHAKLSTQNDIVMFAFLFVGVVVYFLFMAESSYDTPRRKEKQAEQNQQEEQTNATNTRSA